MSDQQKTDPTSLQKMQRMDHAELGRLAKAKQSWSLGVYKNREQAADAAKFNGLDIPATVLALLSDNAALRAERDEVVNAVRKMSVAMSWLDYPFIDNNTSEAELLSRVGYMMKDAEPYRTFLQSIARETGK